MDFKLEHFDSATVEPQHGSYKCELKVYNASAEELVDSLSEKDLEELISKIPYEKVIKYHREDEILNYIGEQKIDAHVKEYFDE